MNIPKLDGIETEAWKRYHTRYNVPDTATRKESRAAAIAANRTTQGGRHEDK